MTPCPRLLLVWTLLVWPWSSTLAAEPAQFRIEQARAYVDEAQVVVISRARHLFPEAALEALQNGVALEVVHEAELLCERALWWDELVEAASQRYLLEYHALANQYVLTNLSANSRQTYRSLAPLLDELNATRELPLGPATGLSQARTYRVRVRARLDIESLPAPLRPMAYVSEAWQLRSGWRDWVLQWQK